MRWNWNDYEQLICQRSRIWLIVKSVCVAHDYRSFSGGAHEICLFVCLSVCVRMKMKCFWKSLLLLSFQAIWIFKICPRLRKCWVWVWVNLATHTDEPMLQSGTDSVWVEMTASLNISCLHNLINRIKSILRRDAFHNKAGRQALHPSHPSTHAPNKFNVFKCTCE